jgi:uncharacterized protein (DUF433 family)
MKKYISTNPEILKGKPVITGTRVPVSRIIFLLQEGYTLENIQEQYPFVTLDTLHGVISELREKLDHNLYATS